MGEGRGAEGEEGSPEGVDVEERGEGLACLGHGKEGRLVGKGENVDNDFDREVQQVVPRLICLFHPHTHNSNHAHNSNHNSNQVSTVQ